MRRDIRFNAQGDIVVTTDTMTETVKSGVVLLTTDQMVEATKHGWHEAGAHPSETELGLTRARRT